MGVTHPFLVLVMFSIKEKEETKALFDASSMSGATMLMLVRTTMDSSGLPFQYLIGVSIQRVLRF
jgi:integral membrane sensor domain MASE1